VGPIVHLSFTATLLTGARLAGYNVNTEIAVASLIGGIFLDGDKAIEIVVSREKKKKGEIPDITARCRILHSIFAFPFGLLLSFAVGSWLPFIAVLLHIFADSFIPGIEQDGKYYPSHSRRKWLANPFLKKSWKKVAIGWPVTYPAELNWVYKKLCPAIGFFLFIASSVYWLMVIILTTCE